VILNWRGWIFGRGAAVASDRCVADCTALDCAVAECSLAACANGARATVRHLRCPQPEAARLRALGVYEGASVGVVDRRNGVLLDVCGSRLALDIGIAASIVVVLTAA